MDMKEDMVMMKDGEMMPMEEDMTMADGTKVMMNGMVMMADGTSHMLMEGEAVTLDGKLTRMEDM